MGTGHIPSVGLCDGRQVTDMILGRSRGVMVTTSAGLTGRCETHLLRAQIE